MTLTNKSLVVLVFLQGAHSASMAAPDFSLSIHGDATAGISDRGHEHTATHGHDPNGDYNLQGIDVGLSMRTEYVEGFVNGNVYLTSEDKVDSEWEEGFIKFKNLPQNIEVRAGRYLNRVGTENNVHLHGWDFVNASMSTGLFLGEDGLRSDGVELSWLKSFENGELIISGSYGKAVTHEHDHGDDHDDEDDHDHDESQELAYFSDVLFTIRSQFIYNTTDFVMHKFGVSYAQGENGYGRDTDLFGADYTFTWRENGLESGGQAVSAGIEYFYRNVQWVEEDDASHSGESAQNSLAVKASYAWNDNWKLGARYEWMDEAGGDDFSMAERQRASIALSYVKALNDDWSTHARLQYNHDKVADERSNNAYLQLGFSFGKGEVR